LGDRQDEHEIEEELERRHPRIRAGDGADPRPTGRANVGALVGHRAIISDDAAWWPEPDRSLPTTPRVRNDLSDKGISVATTAASPVADLFAAGIPPIPAASSSVALSRVGSAVVTRSCAVTNAVSSGQEIAPLNDHMRATLIASG